MLLLLLLAIKTDDNTVSEIQGPQGIVSRTNLFVLLRGAGAAIVVLALPVTLLGADRRRHLLGWSLAKAKRGRERAVRVLGLLSGRGSVGLRLFRVIIRGRIIVRGVTVVDGTQPSDDAPWGIVVRVAHGWGI